MCDFSDAYFVAKGIIIVTEQDNAKRNKSVAFKNNAPFTNCISEINAVDIVIPMYNLLEYSKNYRKMTGTTNLIISNEEMSDIVKIVQALEDFNILLKGVTKTIKKETKEQKGGFLSKLLDTLGASLLGNLLTGKVIVRAGSGNKKGKEVVRDGYGKEWDF